MRCIGADHHRPEAASVETASAIHLASLQPASHHLCGNLRGTAMELLGRTVSDAEGTVYEGIALADFTTVQGKKRLVEDVYGTTDLYPEAVVGFMNKCGVTTGPLSDTP